MSDTQTFDVTPKQADRRLEHFPVPFFSSVMGTAGLVLALHATSSHDRLGQAASAAALMATVGLFLILIVIYGLKAARYPSAVRAEWNHPVKLAFFPALSISLLLIATALRPDWPELARVVWVIGAVAQAGLTLAVLSNWIGHRRFDTLHISPAWFIPAVGNVVAPVAGVGLGFPETSWLFFSAGMTFWVVLLVLVMNRLVFHDPLPGKMVPTLAILIAPPAVAFLAWLQLNGGEIDAFARYLYGSAIVFSALALTQIGKLSGQPFALSWWALSFPVAALTIATQQFGMLGASVVHVMAARGLLIVLLVIVGLLLALTARAVARHQLCRPE